MKHYELLCVLPGTLGEDEVAPVVAEVSALLAANGASDVATEDRGKSRLAYPMKHIRYGYFTLFTFSAERASIPVIQAKLRLVNQLLRAMINEFDPDMRREKDEQLAKLAKERADALPAAPVAEAPVMPAAPVAEIAEEAPAKKSKKALTEKPTEENMNQIEKKLDQVLDSTLEEV